MQNWTEVTDPKEIKRLNKQLKERLYEAAPVGKPFRIGYPAGSFEARVRFVPVSNEQIFWVYSGETPKTKDFMTLVGHAPDHHGALLIDIQFNFPKDRFSRRKGGAFVKDANGRAFLAHRGIVTKGNSRISKNAVFEHIEWSKHIVAHSNVKPGKVELFLVAALDDRRLIREIQQFAHAMRDAANFIASQKKHQDRTNKKPVDREPDKDVLSQTLSKYRDEFSEAIVAHRKGTVVMDWTHGRIVRELKNKLIKRGEILVCKANDLILFDRNIVYLFEIKPSSKSQSIYTAIGQLIFNGFSLQNEYPTREVRKLLVLPNSTKHQARQERCRELGFDLVTFEPSGTGYKFTGLP